MSAIDDLMVPLFVPANRPERFEKAALSNADAIILDLEDAVSLDAKESARNALRDDFSACPIIVRVNGIGTPWHAADVAAVVQRRFAAVIVPKAEANAAFETLCTTLPIPVIALVETARGLADARRLAATPNVVRLAFGSIDYCADLQCAHDRDVLLPVRSELVLASRLAAIAPPIEGVTTAIDDEALIADDARHARSLGFGGKLCIHPKQIPAIRQGFAPSAAEIDWAHRILASGVGAVAVDGAMVDEPVRIRARAVLKRANPR